MKKSEINILVIDDENLVAEPIIKALNRSGYNAKYVKKLEEAQREVQIKEYQLAIIDCMLPKVNGVEVATQLNNNLSNKIKIILMSGIFKDIGFKKDAINKTKAIDFLEKPFNLDELLEKVDEAFSDVIDPELPPIQQLFQKPFNYDNVEVFKTINNLGTIHGFEVPLILSVLNSCKASGVIELKGSSSPIKIKLTQGYIYQVESNDTESYFGVLLIENGFSTPEEVAKGLALESQLPIGQRLWSTNTLSSHAIDIVHQEQLSIRLSKIIKADNYEINFREDNSVNSSLFISNESFYRFLNDWISTKIKSDWLLSYYTPWSDFKVQKGRNFSLLDSLKNIALVNLSPDINKAVINNELFSNLLNENKGKPFLLQSIYFLLLLEIIKFSEEKTTLVNFDFALQRVKNLKENFKNKNHYQILGVEKNTPKEKIQQAFHNFAIYLHPDKVPQNAPEELRNLTTEVFQVLTEAHQTLTNSQLKDKYNFELEHGKAEQIIHSENLFERGVLLLNNKKYDEASDLFDQVYELDMYSDDFFVYYCWALLKGDLRLLKKENS